MSSPQCSSKRCFDCQETKPLLDFHKDSSRTCGHGNRCKSCAKTYYQANRLRKLCIQKALEANERAVYYGVEGKQTADRLIAALEGQNEICSYCEERLGSRWHVDHMVPFFLGGSNCDENIVICCEDCNLNKGRKPIEDFWHDYLSPRLKRRVLQESA